MGALRRHLMVARARHLVSSVAGSLRHGVRTGQAVHGEDAHDDERRNEGDPQPSRSAPGNHATERSRRRHRNISGGSSRRGRSGDVTLPTRRSVRRRRPRAVSRPANTPPGGHPPPPVTTWGSASGAERARRARRVAMTRLLRMLPMRHEDRSDATVRSRPPRHRPTLRPPRAARQHCASRPEASRDPGRRLPR